MKSTDPQKHKTPNWRLVRHSFKVADIFGKVRETFFYRWQPMPLRSTRKDLEVTPT